MSQKLVKVDMRGFVKYRDAIRNDLTNPQSAGLIRGVFKGWAVRWRSVMQERFVRYSRGGGDWAPLAESTKRARRKGRGKGNVAVSILWDKLGSIFKALTPAWIGSPGQFEKGIPFGITVGFGGPARHPGGAATIADIAAFHHEGSGNLPERTLIDDVPQMVVAAMRVDLEKACIKLASDTNITR